MNDYLTRNAVIRKGSVPHALLVVLSKHPGLTIRETHELTRLDTSTIGKGYAALVCHGYVTRSSRDGLPRSIPRRHTITATGTVAMTEAKSDHEMVEELGQRARKEAESRKEDVQNLATHQKAIAATRALQVEKSEARADRIRHGTATVADACSYYLAEWRGRIVGRIPTSFKVVETKRLEHTPPRKQKDTRPRRRGGHPHRPPAPDHPSGHLNYGCSIHGPRFCNYRPTITEEPNARTRTEVE